MNSGTVSTREFPYGVRCVDCGTPMRNGTRYVPVSRRWGRTIVCVRCAGELGYPEIRCRNYDRCGRKFQTGGRDIRTEAPKWQWIVNDTAGHLCPTCKEAGQ